LVLAGHQPELFHPGVWVKNCALAGLARRHGVTALNLIVDNDIVKSTFLRLPAPPTPDAPLPHLVRVPFAEWHGEAPWEERTVQDAALFDSFADRALAVLRPWGYEPLLGPFWADVRRPAGWPIGERFAAARRKLERAWGCHNLELPISALCRTEAFGSFACGLLADLPRFHGPYNAVVREYRARHGIRSRNHPVPDLAEQDGWLEAPFWGWRAGQPRRARLFVRMRPGELELRAGNDVWPALPRSGPACAWPELERRGLKVRSRALTTTLYARLFLGDLFMHGIGGGKYDELTDELMRRFYGIEPPVFMVLSATRWLPLPAASVTADDQHRLARQLRDVYWNPQRHLVPGAGLDEVVRAKEAWFKPEPSDGAGRRQRFRAVRALNEQLRSAVAPLEERLRKELQEIERQLAGNAVLQRRDYAFCIYPEDTLRPFCARFL
jgi:hypothetical protein